MSEKKKVFVSHSSVDKPFVRKLVDDLKGLGLDDVWFDERAIAIGESIPQEINEGLKDADYLIFVLTPDSVSSRWVRMELDAVLMKSDIVILPVLWKDCDIPELLKARKYADFRDDSNYDVQFGQLAAVLTDEQAQLPKISETQVASNVSPDVEELNRKTRSGLRRWIIREQKFDRDQVIMLWRDLLHEEMENDHRRSPLGDCVSLLIGKMIDQGRHSELLEELCAEANP